MLANLPFLLSTMKLGQGYIFTDVCDSVQMGGVPGQVHTPPGPGTPQNQVYPPGPGTPLGPGTPPLGPGTPPRTRYPSPGSRYPSPGLGTQQVGCTQPTGMHSCCI